jgi:hypothetical protein
MLLRLLGEVVHPFLVEGQLIEVMPEQVRQEETMAAAAAALTGWEALPQVVPVLPVWF